MSTTTFVYNPEFQTIIRYKDDVEVGRLSAQPDELPSLGEYLWDYLQLRKFIVKIENVEATPDLQ